MLQRSGSDGFGLRSASMKSAIVDLDSGLEEVLKMIDTFSEVIRLVVKIKKQYVDDCDG